LSRFQNADGIPTSNQGVSNQEDINKIGALYKTVPIFNRSSHLSHGQLDLVQPSSYTTDILAGDRTWENQRRNGKMELTMPLGESP
jgi:hypothetical protein